MDMGHVLQMLTKIGRIKQKPEPWLSGSMQNSPAGSDPAQPSPKKWRSGIFLGTSPPAKGTPAQRPPPKPLLISFHP